MVLLVLPARGHTDDDQLVLGDMVLHKLIKLKISDKWNLTLVAPEQENKERKKLNVNLHAAIHIGVLGGAL